MGLTAKAASSEAAEELKQRTQTLQRMAYALLDCADSVKAIKEAIGNDDGVYVCQLWQELSQDEQMALWVAPTKGGIFTTVERQRIREHVAEFAASPELKDLRA